MSFFNSWNNVKVITHFGAVLIFVFVPLSGFAQYVSVGEQTIDYLDTSRNRPVKVEMWYPTLEKDSLRQRITDLPYFLPPTIRNSKMMDEGLTISCFVAWNGRESIRFSLVGH